MSPFNHPEFWLNLSFLIVVGLVAFPPIRQRLQHFFERQRHQVENDIQNAEEVYQKAVQAHQEALKGLKTKGSDKEASQKIKVLQKEFEAQIKNQSQIKKQDFSVRQNLMALQIKNHLRQELLDKAEKKVLSHKKAAVSEKEIAHFIEMLSEKETLLKKAL
ncbi:MAG: hypothetical protein ACI4OR_01250 [Alphaproteobacteria bacterium]